MGAGAPQWLYSAFADTLREIGATASDERLEAEARDLVERWSTPFRRLHNIHHLINVLAHVDELASTTHDPDLLRVAAWYHGLVLNTAVDASVNGSDPSQIAHTCSRLTHGRLTDLGVSRDVADRVSELIRDMADHVAPVDDVDAQVLVDADLAALAASPQDYKKYRAMLREEYGSIDDLTFLRARRAVVRRLLARAAVFQSPRGQAWELRARENLEVELAKLDEAITRIDPGDTEVSSDHIDADVEVVDGPALSASHAPDATTTTGTIIIRRRHVLHKVPPAPEGAADDGSPRETTTGRQEEDGDRSDGESGRLPDLTPLPERPRGGEDSADGQDGEDASSLETAIDALDVPSRPSGQ